MEDIKRHSTKTMKRSLGGMGSNQLNHKLSGHSWKGYFISMSFSFHSYKNWFTFARLNKLNNIVCVRAQSTWKELDKYLFFSCVCVYWGYLVRMPEKWWPNDSGNVEDLF